MAGERDPYFDTMPERQALLWASTVRRQLARWEPLVALHLATTLNREHGTPDTRHITGEEIWRGEAEHHLLVVAARNLLRAVELLDSPPPIDAVFRAELIEVRDLLEHWTDNMPIFNSTPRPREPKYRSGKDYAERNPRSGPYCWWAWDSRRGAHVTPNVSAHDLRAFADAIIDRVVDQSPRLADYVAPAPTTTPWIDPGDHGEWWPKGEPG